MRKLLCVVLASLLTLLLCACGETIVNDGAPSSGPVVQTNELNISGTGTECMTQDDVIPSAGDGTYELGPVPFSSVFNDETVPQDNVKMTLEAMKGDDRFEMWVSKRGENAVIRTGTVIDDQRLLSRLWTIDGSLYFHYTGVYEGEKSKAFYKLPADVMMDSFLDDYGVGIAGISVNSVVTCDYDGMVGNLHVFKIVDDQERCYDYLLDAVTGKAFGFEINGENADDLKFIIRYVDASDQDFNFIADVNVAVDVDSAVVNDIMTSQVLSIARLGQSGNTL